MRGPARVIIPPRARPAGWTSPRRPPGARAASGPTFHARRPRPRGRCTACTKLCSSSASASASGASSITRSTTSGELGAGARPPVAAQPHELAAAGREVEGEVAVGLEQPQPSHPLPRGAARSVCHRPVGELDPRVRGIQVGRKHRDARGPDLGGLGAAGEVEHEIEVVDHEISTTATPCPGAGTAPAGGSRCSGAIQVGSAARMAVVALDVPDLELHPLRRRGRDQLVRLLQRGGERLLHQHRDAALQRAEADFGVRRRRNGDRHRIDPPQQAIQRAGLGAAPPPRRAPDQSRYR